MGAALGASLETVVGRADKEGAFDKVGNADGSAEAVGSAESVGTAVMGDAVGDTGRTKTVSETSASGEDVGSPNMALWSSTGAKVKSWVGRAATGDATGALVLLDEPLPVEVCESPASEDAVGAAQIGRAHV